MRNGSSPKVSLTRPQRRSRAMHSTGEKVQWMPVAATSTAVARATRSSRSGSHVAAMPSCVGKIVAPSPERVAVDAVLADEQRDPQPRLRRQLGLRARRARATCAGSSRRATSARWSSTSSRASSCIICPTFSAQRHAAQEVGDPLRDRQRGVAVRQGFGHHEVSIGSVCAGHGCRRRPTQRRATTLTPVQHSPSPNVGARRRGTPGSTSPSRPGGKGGPGHQSCTVPSASRLNGR